MLTKIEMKVLDLIYSIVCKSFTVPFQWNNGSISLKQYLNVWNYILWLLLMSSLVLKLYMMFQTKHINELILSTIFVLSISGTIVFQLSIWLYQTELVQLINQIFHMNSCWGKNKIVTLLSIPQECFM